MWRELILELCPGAGFNEPASEEQITSAERALGVHLPKELKELLGESNGVADHFGFYIIWPCEEIVGRNVEFRTADGFADLYMPFDHLLFFGVAGNGDQFAYPLVRGGVRKPEDIFLWDHETDSRALLAYGLKRLLRHQLVSDADGDGE